MTLKCFTVLFSGSALHHNLSLLQATHLVHWASLWGRPQHWCMKGACITADSEATHHSNSSQRLEWWICVLKSLSTLLLLILCVMLIMLCVWYVACVSGPLCAAVTTCALIVLFRSLEVVKEVAPLSPLWMKLSDCQTRSVSHEQ